jgi:hypothetical protein
MSLAAKTSNTKFYVVNNTSSSLTGLTTLIPSLEVIDAGANLGYGRAANLGIAHALADPMVTAVLLVNNDLTVESGTLSMLTLALRKLPQAGIVAPLLHHTRGYDWGGTFSPWWGKVAHKNWPNKPKTYVKVDHAAGAAMLIRREVIERVGLFDERFFLYYEDVDYCLRVHRAGYTVQLVPELVFAHQGSASSSRLTRTLAEWRAHLQFVMKYLPRTVYPTAISADLFLYPLYLLKSLLPL